MIAGHVLLVLHAHLPFVRHPEHPDFLEEDWLFEAISEVYVPLLAAFDRLHADGVPFQLGFTVSPTLASMLGDQLLRSRYTARLDATCALAEAEVARTARVAPHHAEAARYHRDRLWAVREQYQGAYGGDLLGAFRRLAAAGHLELYTCTATHGFLPVLRPEPSSVHAQVAVAVQAHRALLGEPPRGIWLAECGYYPGVEEVLARHGLRAFFVDAHGLWRGTPAPVFGVFQPVLTPAGVAAFGRDPACSEQVWSAEVGYPADPDYLEFHLDLAHHVDAAWLRPYLNPDSGRRLTGLRYHRVTGRTGPKAPYGPGAARAKAEAHAAHFLSQRARQLEEVGRRIAPREPLVLAPYDAELFGHWWAEGPVFLEALLRGAGGTGAVRFTGPLAYLERFPDMQVVQPAESSWGARGDASTWIGPASDWMYRHLHEAARRMTVAADAHPRAEGPARRVLQQAARELLLAQSSDWAFILHTGAAPEYAARRVRGHLGAVFGLLDQLEAGRVDAAWLAQLEGRNNLFPAVDPGVYRSLP